jgi:hypothetical protein
MATGTSELDFRVQVIVPVYWIPFACLYTLPAALQAYMYHRIYILTLRCEVVVVPRCRRPEMG